MPHVVVKLFAGRSEEQKSKLAAQWVKDVIGVSATGRAANGDPELRRGVSFSRDDLIAESVKRFSPSSTDAGGERIHRESRWVPLVCDLIYRGKNRLE